MVTGAMNNGRFALADGSTMTIGMGGFGLLTKIGKAQIGVLNSTSTVSTDVPNQGNPGFPPASIALGKHA